MNRWFFARPAAVNELRCNSAGCLLRPQRAAAAETQRSPTWRPSLQRVLSTRCTCSTTSAQLRLTAEMMSVSRLLPQAD